jgi:hypothetical protein
VDGFGVAYVYDVKVTKLKDIGDELRDLRLVVDD